MNHKLLLYRNHSYSVGTPSSSKNFNGEIWRFVLMKPQNKEQIYEVWNTLIENLGEEVVTINTPLLG
jgi:hypothetical protein